MKPWQRLRRARKRNRLDIEELSVMTGIDKRRLWRLEKGTQPKMSEIPKLCDALNMSSDWWFRGDIAAPEMIIRKLFEMDYQERAEFMDMYDDFKRSK